MYRCIYVYIYIYLRGFMKNKELKVSMDLYPTQLYCNKRTLQTGICQSYYIQMVHLSN